MIARKWKPVVAALSPILVAGCVSASDIEKYSTPLAGFSNVAAQTKSVANKQAVWIQNREQAEIVSKRVHGMIHKKTINANTAVQVALLNNKGLQAVYADLGLSAAEVWQQTMLENPRVSIGLFGIAQPGLGAFRSLEAVIVGNILALATQKRRVGIADAHFRQAQMRAVVATLALATETRRAWITSVGAFETIRHFNRAQTAADASSELAKRLGESGALAKAGQARQHVFYAELTGEKAQAKLAAKLEKGNLTKLMGLWGSEVNYFVPNRLPRLPRNIKRLKRVEMTALLKRPDLKVAKLELEAVAKSYGLTQATRYVTDLEIIAGFESERELEEGSRETLTTPQVELEFVIPIFDSGKARMRKAELTYMRAANLLAEKAVNIRSEARGAYLSYRSTYSIARHYRRNVVPLRAKIEAEALLSYNGMITNTFELLADIRAKVNAIVLSVDAKRDFWLANANLSAAVYGGGAFHSGGKQVITVANNKDGAE